MTRARAQGPSRDLAGQVRNVAGAVALAASVAAMVSAQKVAPAAIGGYGLISVVPVLVWLALAMLVVSFALHVSAPALSGPRLGLHVVAWVLLLHGLPGFLEHEPPFPSAWISVGFVNAFIRHGHPYNLDARFFWPGFFTTAGAFVGFNGWSSALPLLRWTPAISDLFFALPIFVIAKLSLRRRGAPWIVVWLFVALNWVGQDYFSPQGFAYFLFLAIIAVVVAAFSQTDAWQLPRARQVGAWLERRGIAARWSPGERVYLPWWSPSGMSLTASQAAGVFAIVVIGAIAITMSHQLTPIALAMDLVALVVLRRCRVTSLPAILILLIVVWLSYAGIDYWSGHVAVLFGSGGVTTVSTGLSSRLAGSTAHLAVVYLRLLIAVALWFLAAGACVWSGLRRRPLDLTLVLLAGAPFLLLVLQSYGGEVPLRVYLYTLPFMICLIVDAISRAALRWSWRGIVAFILVTAIVVPSYFVARFGNESFEQVRPGEIVAVQALYRLAPPGSTLTAMMVNGITWRWRKFADYNYIDDLDVSTPAGIVREIGKHTGPAFLILTTGQIEYAVSSYGLPPDWGTVINRKLAASSHFKLVYRNPDADIYRVR